MKINKKKNKELGLISLFILKENSSQNEGVPFLILKGIENFSDFLYFFAPCKVKLNTVVLSIFLGIKWKKFQGHLDS